MFDKNYYGPEEEDESVDTTCPDCGSDATYDSNGLDCSNPDCENSRID
jgi:hypothetical protein